MAPPQTLRSQRLVGPPVVPPAPRHSQRERRVPNRPGNVYGDNRHPVEQERDTN